jgi:hypothetical protein
MTTSKDELGLAADKMAPPFAEEVYEGMRI